MAETDPSSLRALTQTVPASSANTSPIRSECSTPSGDRSTSKYGDFPSTTSPSLCCQVTRGVGRPDTRTVKHAASPSVTVSERRGSMNAGASLPPTPDPATDRQNYALPYLTFGVVATQGSIQRSGHSELHVNTRLARVGRLSTRQGGGTSTSQVIGRLRVCRAADTVTDQ